MKSSTDIGRDTFRVEIIIHTRNIEVDDKYFSFDYKVWMNNNTEPITGNYSSDHSHCTEKDRESFKKLLKDNHSHRLALEDVLRQI